MTHHHLLPHQKYDTGVARYGSVCRTWCPSHNIRRILNGHTQSFFTGEIQGILYYTVASMSFVGEDEGQGIVRFEERYGYNLYRFESGRLIHQTS